MRWISVCAAMLACTACQPYLDADQTASLSGQLQSDGQTQAACRGFTAPVTAGATPEQASGQACRQPDGSWQIVQNTPGLPSQAYVTPPAGRPPAPAAAAAQPQPGQPACSSYTARVLVGGEPRDAVIAACPQPDGSWKITQYTPGLPPQSYEVPPPAAAGYAAPYPADYAYPEFFPYWAGAPWFFGLGPSIFVVNRVNHFHHGFGHGFGHGGGRGFGRGFGPGFGHGFAARGGGGRR
jgi:surface antigen